MFALRCVLFPTDFSEASLAAFPVACSIARDSGAHLVILYVVPSPLSTDALEAHWDPDRYYKDLWQMLRGLNPTDPAIPVDYRLEEGKAETVILQVAKKVEADMIVLGTHGRTGLAHLLMGSVAEHVVRQATCPVLTVRAPEGPVCVRPRNAIHLPVGALRLRAKTPLAGRGALICGTRSDPPT
jgi:nucleotide-binding universal stress UspA family protein